MKPFYVFLFTCIFCLNSVFAVNILKDTNNVVKDSSLAFVYYFDSYNVPSSPIIVDTGLYGFHRYDPVFKGDFLSLSNGNLGLPHKFSLSNIINSPFGIGDEFLTKYSFLPSNIPYYNLMVPYSNINYSMGSSLENLVDFTLANQISPGLYFGTDLRFESSKGSFLNQRSANNHFRTVFRINSRNEKYFLQFNYLRNKFKFGENGGLLNDFYYSDTIRLDRRIIPVNLLIDSNSLVTNQFLISQYFALGDSNSNRGNLFFDIDYCEKYRVYHDYGSNFNYYKYTFLDSLATSDSSRVKSYFNNFGFQKLTDSLGFSYKLGVGYSRIEYFNGLKFYDFSYLTPNLYLKYQHRNLSIILNGKYQHLLNYKLIQFNSKSYTLNTQVEYFHSSRLKVYAKLNLSSFSPQFRFFSIYSNHYIWFNNFSNIQQKELELGLNLLGFDLKSGLTFLDNYTYIDDLLQPSSFSDFLSIYHLSASKNFRKKWYGSDTYISFQRSSNETVLAVPSLVGRSNLYFSFPLFKGVLQVFPGIEFTFISNYYADSYNPALMLYYRQNSTLIENQYYLDLFINFKIKRARVFLMYKYANMLIGKDNYFQIAHYPLHDSGLKMGLSWRFIN